jgi:hypothetical protein
MLILKIIFFLKKKIILMYFKIKNTKKKKTGIIISNRHIQKFIMGFLMGG